MSSVRVGSQCLPSESKLNHISVSVQTNANITRGSLSKCTKSNQVLSYSPIMCFFGNVGLQQLMQLIVCLSTGIFVFFFLTVK